MRHHLVMSALVLLLLPVAGFCADAPSSMSVGSLKSGAVGKVVETQTAGDYTYVQLEKDGKKAWVASPVMTVAVGKQLAFQGCTPMMNFESKALKRTFSTILFCGDPLPEDAAQLLSKNSTGSAGNVPVSSEKIVVDEAKGANAHTVAEIFAKKNELNGKSVVVKGKVMKISTGIMRRNWIHLQDGTGTPIQKNNDLVVTTSDLAKTGDVVTISGTLAKDKDFGSGYKYTVIVEDAKVGN